MEGEAVYDGIEKLVFCADVGTTQSAVSLIHFQPGSIPRVKLVSRWPGDRLSSKIPSLILYDDSGVSKAFGASALHETVQSTAEDEGWSTCKHWKLYLHPVTGMSAPPPYSPLPTASSVSNLLSNMRVNFDREHRSLGTDGRAFELWPLPPGVTVEKVYSDWFSYLVKSAKIWWEESNPDGAYIWDKLEKTMVFVLSHPNGWALDEQTVMRSALSKAAPRAKLNESTASDRVIFVSEAEAAVHFSLHYTSSSNSLDSWLAPGSQFVVLDAGGSTVDTTVYIVENTQPKLRIRELKPSACVQAGAIFPTRDAMNIVRAKLARSKYGDAETLAEIMAQFDVKTKCDFDDPNIDHVIKIGKDSCNDLAYGIKRGRLTLKGSEVAAAFKPSIDLILDSVKEQLQGCTVKTILLSGGFGESPHLQRRLRSVYEPRGIKVITSDEPSKKAVAEGAAFYYIRESVVARSSRFTYGTTVMRPISAWPSHLRNVGSFKSFVDVDGTEWQRGGFKMILGKGEVMETDAVVSEAFSQDCSCTGSVLASSTKIYVRTSENLDKDSFMIDRQGNHLAEYKHICDVEADLNGLCTNANKRKSPVAGESDYWHVEYKIGICFGGTSLKAWVFWTEKGVEKKGPASVIPSAYL